MSCYCTECTRLMALLPSVHLLYRIVCQICPRHPNALVINYKCLKNSILVLTKLTAPFHFFSQLETRLDCSETYREQAIQHSCHSTSILQYAASLCVNCLSGKDQIKLFSRSIEFAQTFQS